MSHDAFDVAALWAETLHDEIKTIVDRTGIPVEQWRVGGRATKEFPNREDLGYWQGQGLKWVFSWLHWLDNTDWTLWRAPNGDPAIELELSCDFSGVPVRMVIDRVFQDSAGNLIVVDLKTSTRDPDSNLQLGFYASGMEKVFGVRPQFGCYWMARKGNCTPVVPLNHYTPELLGQWLNKFNDAIDNQIFLPHISSLCNSCGVKTACAAVGGADAHTYDPDHPNHRDQRKDQP